jgi:hypothetical protein
MRHVIPKLPSAFRGPMSLFIEVPRDSSDDDAGCHVHIHAPNCGNLNLACNSNHMARATMSWCNSSRNFWSFDTTMHQPCSNSATGVSLLRPWPWLGRYLPEGRNIMIEELPVRHMLFTALISAQLQPPMRSLEACSHRQQRTSAAQRIFARICRAFIGPSMSLFPCETCRRWELTNSSTTLVR